MASLIEDLITTLEEEDKLYLELIPIGEKKSKIIIDNDLEALEKTIELEQSVVQKVTRLEQRRQEVIINIGTVVNRNPSTLDMKTIIKLLDKQPVEQKKLSQIHDSLIKNIKRLMDLNNQNQALIEQSLELIEFNMNFIQSTRMSPGSDNYNKNASGIYDNPIQTRMFDKKQ